eukprot:scaffold30577_cov29-Tisochrysis_lutea.AAC.3
MVEDSYYTQMTVPLPAAFRLPKARRETSNRDIQILYYLPNRKKRTFCPLTLRQCGSPSSLVAIKSSRRSMNESQAYESVLLRHVNRSQ